MYLILDKETSMKIGGFGRDSNPFLDKVLCTGLLYQGKSIPETYITDFLPTGYLKNVNRIVAFNGKFDLLFMWKNPELQQFFKDGGTLYDPQLAEYILSGQRHKYPALRDIAVNKYACASRIKYIEGKKTDDVDIELLLKDVTNDVLDTERVMLIQCVELKKEGMFNLTLSQMEAVLATTEMEFNGMFVNKQVLIKNSTKLKEQLTILEKLLKETISYYWPKELEFNLGSTQQVAKLLFGGNVSYKVLETVKDELGNEVKIKSGKNKGIVKIHNVTYTSIIKGLGAKPHKSQLTKKGNISTNDKVLNYIANSKNGIASNFCKQLLEHRYLSKQINTYYDGFLNLIYPDGCIRGQFSHCGYENEGDVAGGTGTGRLSGNKPNLQNIPRSNTSDVKKHFTSRYGADGCIINFDFSQLEVVAFAFLTQDPVLMQDVLTSDIHTVMVKELFGISKGDISEEEFKNLRTKVKPGTFLLIYGGSARKLSLENNLELDFCEKFVDTFWKRYPIAKAWQDENLRKVRDTSYYIEEYTPRGFQKKEGFLRNVTGRKLYFKTNDNPDFMIDKVFNKLGYKKEQIELMKKNLGNEEFWKWFRERYPHINLTGFNPPDIKDYPVQSFATADIVLITLGLIWRRSILHRDKFLMIGTVHDSGTFDCKKEFIEDCYNVINDSLYYLKKELKKLFNIDFNLNIKVDIEIGDSWGELMSLEKYREVKYVE